MHLGGESELEGVGIPGLRIIGELDQERAPGRERVVYAVSWSPPGAVMTARLLLQVERAKRGEGWSASGVSFDPVTGSATLAECLPGVAPRDDLPASKKTKATLYYPGILTLTYESS